MKNSRYFYIAAKSANWDGSITLNTEDGQYFREVDIFSSLKDRYPGISGHISIINVIEFSEQEYYTFIDDAESKL